MDRLLPRFPDPLTQAREYLRLRGVAYNDLITGDHAATLLYEWTKAITDRDAQIVKLMDEWKLNQLPRVLCIADPGEPPKEKPE